MLRRKDRVRSCERMIKTQSGISGRIGSIERDGLLEILAHAFVTGCVEIPPMITPFQIQLVRFSIFRRSRRDRALFRAAEFCLQRVRDFRRDVGFHREDVVELSIVTLGPEMRVALGIDELDVDAHAVAGFAHTAFQDVGNSKLLRDLANVLGRVFETLRRRARDHFQIANAREAGEDFLLDTVGKISVRFIFAQIFKRQDGDRFAQNRRARLRFFLGRFIGFKLIWRLRIADLV